MREIYWRQAILILPFAFFLNVCLAQDSADGLTLPINFEITSKTGQKGKLLLKLTNTSGKALTVDRSSFDRLRYTFLLIKDGPYSGEPMQEHIAMAHPVGDVELAPGESVTDEFDLSTSFPEYKESIQRFDLLFFWYAKIRSPADRKLMRFGGVVLIPKEIN